MREIPPCSNWLPLPFMAPIHHLPSTAIDILSFGVLDLLVTTTG